jgi:23S rRNA (cytidine1920-2'-O)/16S rRNA (cytidine1409-2'-O)-methyltransferase
MQTQVDPIETIRRGVVLVDGVVRTNPDTLVREDASIALHADAPLRGEVKLRAAIHRFDVRVDGRVALDLGAAAGGFTRVLLEKGASRVYAVDAGYGQLLGSLRQHPCVVNLERTNLADLSRDLVPEPVQLVAVDLSYLSLSAAMPQLLGKIELDRDAELVALVKPQFELGLAEPPADAESLGHAVARAAAGLERAGWKLLESTRSPVRGARGSIEFFVHARRSKASS